MQASHADAELTELERRILRFEHGHARHDRRKEADIRGAFDMSPARYYQVLNRVIDSADAVAFDPQLVARLRRLRQERVGARAARAFTTARADAGSEEER